MQRERETFGSRANDKVLTISYDQLRRRATRLAKVCDLIFCDEGHRLKSKHSATAKQLGEMAVRRHVILSGAETSSTQCPPRYLRGFARLPGILPGADMLEPGCGCESGERAAGAAAMRT